ncbi:MAG: hypothetical protein J6J74_08330 [Elusimicrobiaceae bacterium]|nr:hypothetical protein [Clostridia bacterium]MBP3514465.1 hypothetical protein [Elusimicrobiaceae bacterium]
METCFDKVMRQKEAEQLRPLIRKWETLSENMRDQPVHAPILLPDMLWVAKSGVGKTFFLELIAEYLESKGNLMEFYGDVKFFEFVLGYTPPAAPFSELQRLMEAVKNAAGFRSEFKGILRIDVDEWVDHYEERYFAHFMEYLAAHKDTWFIILSVSCADKQKLHNLEAFLSMFLRIERVELKLPNTQDLTDYIEKNLAAYGLTLATDGRELLGKTVDKMRKNKYFDGYKSLGLLCQEIAYTVFSSGKLATRELHADTLAAFAPDSAYVERTVANLEKVNTIGLVKGGAV